ncbi:MAG: hypothetical protein IPP69_04480 [Flavobacteriales bacterium]|nr:hypothetical protein [Flavobacteriales bacterium]
MGVFLVNVHSLYRNNMKTCILFLMALLLSEELSSQTKIYDHVRIDENSLVYKDVVVRRDDPNSAKSIVTFKKEENVGGETKTTVRTYSGGEKYEFIETVSSKQMEGLCNIVTSEKISDRFYLNYWLYPNVQIESNMSVQVQNYKYVWSETQKSALNTEDGSPVNYTEKFLENCYHDQEKFPDLDAAKKAPWFIMVEKVFIVKVTYKSPKLHKDDTQTRYYFYFGDESNKYYIKLENRNSVNLPRRSWDFGAITIPIKIRLSNQQVNFYDPSGKFIESRDPIYNELTADANLGLFAGYSLGKYSVRNNGENISKLNQYNFTFGLCGSFGGVALIWLQQERALIILNQMKNLQSR